MTCDVSELIRAANEISKLSPSETDRLFQRAAATIGDYREQIAYSERNINDLSQGDIVFELTIMAAYRFVPTREDVAMILEVVKVMEGVQGAARQETET
ncbi:hypothetical protein [Aminobacter carboxidus]|uniref:Uncharacterized protein n=1 Tax=Aminobacter carboxidus TaxID=376165 RepID=A0ABR9GQJ7_9HYPH|nr:hypothetical protein [Aminobacter carboxidus]MBE1205967.1 hypothetical protein [Aminobacter carboxidus]